VPEEYYDAIVIKETKKIPIDKIQVSNLHVRQSAVTKDLEILAKNIRKTGGLLIPVVVFEIDGGMYELIVGQRRFLAYKHILKWTEIMAMIIEKPTSDMMKVTISFMETSSQMKITEKDRMKVINDMYAKLIPIQKIGEILGITTQKVKACIQLPRVPDVVRDAVENGEIPVRIAVRATDAMNFEKYITDESKGADVLNLAKKLIENKFTMSQLRACEEFGKSNPDATNEEIMQGGIDNSKVTIQVHLTSSDNRRIERYAENNGLSFEAARLKLILDTLDETEE
jgi:ParB/RepB/Spo0J family partition protein